MLAFSGEKKMIIGEMILASVNVNSTGNMTNSVISDKTITKGYGYE